MSTSYTDATRNGTRRVRVPKISELVAGSLRREIVLGTLNEGDALASESELMAEFGVSRPTLREAFRILESEGLISVMRGTKGGTRVHSPSAEVAARYTGWVLQHQHSSLAEVYAARVALEARCAAILAARRTQKDLDVLRETYESNQASLTENAGDPQQLAQVSHQMHRAVVSLSGNTALTLLANMVDVILDRADVQQAELAQSSRGIQQMWERDQRAHAKLLKLITDRESEAAGLFWSEHLEQSAEQVLRNLGSKSVIDFME